MKNINILSIILFMVSSTAQAIVCTAAKSDVEKKICASEPLMQLDTALNKWFYQVDKSQINSEKLYQDEKSWLQQRNQCTDDECLIASYKLRLSQLRDIERFSDAKVITHLLSPVRMTQNLPYTEEDSTISVSGSEYTLHAKDWVYKPFYSHDERVKLLEQLKKNNPHATSETRIEKIVGGFVANNTTYLYILHYNGSHYYDDARRKNHYKNTWQLVQISEQGDVTIVDNSNDENKPAQSEFNYRMHTFTIDAQGNIYFINNINAQPVLKKWSIYNQQLDTLPESERIQYQDKYTSKGIWSWIGQCEGAECKSRVGSNDSAHFALRYPIPGRKNPNDKYTSYDAYFSDGLFYVQQNGMINPIIKENNDNKNTWFLFSEPESSDEETGYFINHHGMAGIWQINQKAKKLTHITPLSHIEKLSVMRHKNNDYLFMAFDITDNIYVATSASTLKN